METARIRNEKPKSGTLQQEIGHCATREKARELGGKFKKFSFLVWFFTRNEKSIVPERGILLDLDRDGPAQRALGTPLAIDHDAELLSPQIKVDSPPVDVKVLQTNALQS